MGEGMVGRWGRDKRGMEEGWERDGKGMGEGWGEKREKREERGERREERREKGEEGRERQPKQHLCVCMLLVLCWKDERAYVCSCDVSCWMWLVQSISSGMAARSANVRCSGSICTARSRPASTTVCAN